MVEPNCFGMAGWSLLMTPAASNCFSGLLSFDTSEPASDAELFLSAGGVFKGDGKAWDFSWKGLSGNCSSAILLSFPGPSIPLKKVSPHLRWSVPIMSSMDWIAASFGFFLSLTPHSTVSSWLLAQDHDEILHLYRKHQTFRNIYTYRRGNEAWTPWVRKPK